MLFTHLFLALFALYLPSPTLAQSIYIDRVPAYTSLACCAQVPLSTIIRGMADKCGDNNALTSYACFCTSSSSYVSSQISSLAYKACNSNGTQADQAVDVFNSYCQVGTSTNQAIITKVTSTAFCTGFSNSTNTARPAGTGVTTTGASATAAPPASSSTSTSAASLIRKLSYEKAMLRILVLVIIVGYEYL